MSEKLSQDSPKDITNNFIRNINESLSIGLISHDQIQLLLHINQMPDLLLRGQFDIAAFDIFFKNLDEAKQTSIRNNFFKNLLKYHIEDKNKLLKHFGLVPAIQMFDNKDKINNNI